MSESPALVLAWIAGAGLGAMFFGGLWWTVRQGLTSQRSALWLFTSLLVRIGIALIGFYFVGHGNWQRLVACLLGFVVARLVVTWLANLPEQTRPAQEPGRAP